MGLPLLDRAFDRTVEKLACGWRPALLACAMALAAAAGHAEPAKQVLLLQSLNRGNLALDHFTGAFRVSLDRRAGSPVNLVEVTVGPSGFVGASERALVDYINSIYEGRSPPDLIVSTGGPSAAFARRHRDNLFKTRPLLFASVDERWFRGSTFLDNESAVPVRNDFPRLVDDILQVLPSTQRVFMVIGSGSIANFWRPQLETEFERFRGRVDFAWSNELSFEEIRQRCANLPPNSAILYISFSSDLTGGAYADEQVVADLHRKANAPIFAPTSSYLGYGVVGGSMMSIGELADTTADVANRILQGGLPGGLRLPAQAAGQPTFDWRELQRWKIPETRLPPGSVVHYRAPGMWEEYRPAVLAAAGLLLVQSLLIAWLLYERRARQRAQLESRRNLALAADSNRRETISVLANSIGHELAQPLASIVLNSHALKLLAEKGAMSDATMGEIVADIESEANRATQIIDRHRAMLRSRELERSRIDFHAVIGEALTLMAHDLHARDIQVTCELAAGGATVDGDPVLLEQVLVNLLRNAMDALAAKPPAQRRIVIRTTASDAGIEVAVSDNGPGLPAHVLGTTFAPFVTTKPHGLGIGLPIAERIVETHGGTLRAHGNADRGATFTITLPRSVPA